MSAHTHAHEIHTLHFLAEIQRHKWFSVRLFTTIIHHKKYTENSFDRSVFILVFILPAFSHLHFPTSIQMKSFPVPRINISCVKKLVTVITHSLHTCYILITWVAQRNLLKPKRGGSIPQGIMKMFNKTIWSSQGNGKDYMTFKYCKYILNLKELLHFRACWANTSFPPPLLLVKKMFSFPVYISTKLTYFRAWGQHTRMRTWSKASDPQYKVRSQVNSELFPTPVFSSPNNRRQKLSYIVIAISTVAHSFYLALLLVFRWFCMHYLSNSDI